MRHSSSKVKIILLELEGKQIQIKFFVKLDCLIVSGELWFE